MSLVREFAIEPKIMATWSHFQSLWEDFGVGKGRLIAKYPVQWKQKVAEELTKHPIGDVHAHKIKSKIWADEHKFLVKSRTYTGTMDWLGNAWAQMSLDPFHAIIACENPKALKEVLVAGEFSKDEAPYQAASQVAVRRNAADMANCAKLLLCHCEEIRLVDPYFDPSEPRFLNTFAAFLQARATSSPSLRLLEIHRARPEPYLPGAQKGKYVRHLAGLVPTGLTLRVFFWRQKPGGLEMHPRFILTDLGGMNFENGLDEGELGTVTLVTLLDCPVWQKYASDYCRSSTTFDLGTDGLIEIAGEG
jgi:hypothetical protein